ncbi:MAG: rod shape-determining protein RodA [Candidatus Daviesbacteria bacterium]|nr:rod shape-determining protein RodA [Candidatus Daviesbacteria bacterium]
MSEATKINWPITICIGFLLAISLLVIYSSSKELALLQAVYAAIGLVFYFLLSQFDYRVFKNTAYPLYIVILLLLLLTLVLGFETRGAIRWIPLGLFNIQPSEFAKPVLILILAHFWTYHIPNWRNIFKSLLWMMVPGILIYKQPDLGTFLTILAIWTGMLFAARISFKKILTLILITALTFPLVWVTLHDYQRSRVTSFLSPGSDPLGTGYNIIQSTIAVGSGQFLGRGLGHGTQSRLQFLPEFRTDFIFASIVEELGFVGSILILLIYFYLLSYTLKKAEESSDAYGYLIIFGTVSMIFFQTVVNVGMNLGIFPITGITLPLISYGGSSLISILISLGIVCSVIRYRKAIDTSLEEG